MGHDNKSGAEADRVGTWRLINRVVEFQDTGEKISEPWQGRLMIQPDDKFAMVVAKVGRTAPTTQAEQAATLTSMLAVSGTAKREGNVSLVTYATASHPQLIGREFRATTEVSGNHYHIETSWGPNPAYANRATRTTTDWERE